jgi:hypothetical protein
MWLSSTVQCALFMTVSLYYQYTVNKIRDGHNSEALDCRHWDTGA